MLNYNKSRRTLFTYLLTANYEHGLLKRVKRFFLLILALILFVPVSASAQTTSGSLSILPVPPQDTPANLFGQNQFYTLTLRGNGEAVVTFKAIVSNTGTTPLETVSLILPENISPAEMIAYQVIQEPQCIRYLPQPLISDTKTLTPAVMKETCAEYQQPDYQYLYGSTTYQRIQNETQNNTILLKLPTPIEPNKNGAYFVYYRTNTITQKDVFGAYDYKFVTLKTEDKINSLQVGISTDADYILRGAIGDVNYGGTMTMAALPATDSMSSGIRNAQFDQFYNQIGTGKIIKQASDLAPKETYEVSGSYAKSQAILYGKEIATGVGIFLLIVLITIIVAKVVINKVSGKKAAKDEASVAVLKNRNKTFLIAMTISFVSMLFVSLYTFAIYAVSQLLNPSMGYGYSNSESILVLFVFAVSAFVYLFFFLAPAIGMGIKKGMGWALVTFASTVIWAILFLLVLFLLLLFLAPKNNNGFPTPFAATSFMGGRAEPAASIDLAVPATAVEAPVETVTTTVESTAPQTFEVQPSGVQSFQVQPLNTVEIKTVETKTTQ